MGSREGQKVAKVGKMNKTIFAKMAAATSKEIGSDFKAEVFLKALERAKRWVRAAYGFCDMTSYVNESGYSIAAYYLEVASKTETIFNRRTMTNLTGGR